MSLLNKIINESLLQDKLNSELADISYRAVNGKRQKERNFSEGMLNVGTIHFNTPKSQITKDMILDYQDEQQQKYYEDATGQKLQYFPTEVTDALNTYTPIQLGALGREATEADLYTETEKLKQLYDELETINQTTRDTINEGKKIQKDIALADENIKIYKDRDKKINLEIKEITRLLDIINKINSKPAGATLTEKEQELVSKETELTDKAAELQTELGNIQSNLAGEQKIKALHEKDLIQKRQELRTLRTVDIPAKEKEIEDQSQVIPQLKENIEENRLEQLKVKNENKPIVKKYEEAFNIANRNRYQVQQAPNESDDDYLKRIQSIEQLPFDENIFKDKAAVEESRKLMKNLKQVLRDDVKISEIVRSFPQPEDVYEINKYFKQVSKRLLNIFGFDNKNVKFNDYVDEIKKTIEILQSAPEEDFIVQDAPAIPTVAPAPAAATPLAHKDGSPSDFEYKIVDNSLYIKNTANGKHIYIKIGRRDRNLIFFSSTTNNQGNFTFFSFRGSSSNTWSFVMMHVMQLLTDANEDIYDQLFGDTTKSDEIFDFLKTKHGLTEIEGIKKVVHATSGVNRALTFGWGMKHDEIPKYCKFGKNIILLNKLYYKNTLSVKDSNMHAIEHFPNIHVSETLVKIIFDLCKNTQPTKVILDTLTTQEKELLDMLLYISGLHKNINNKKDDHVVKLKDRLKLVESEIRAGNNNPVLKSELKDLIHKLHLFGAVSLYNANNYLKQF